MTERTVTTSGQGRAVTPPEFAEVRAWIEGRHDSAAIARDRAHDRIAVVRDAVVSDGISDDHVRLTDFRIEHRGDGFEFSSDDPDHRADATLTVDCLPETAGDVVTAITDAGEGTGIECVEFTVGDATRERLQEQALDEAMSTARRRAETIAASESLSAGSLVEVTTTTSPDFDSTGDIVDDALGNTTSRSFQPDPIEVTAAVEATFELERASTS